MSQFCSRSGQVGSWADKVRGVPTLRPPPPPTHHLQTLSDEGELFSSTFCSFGARCISVLRAFAHGAMGRLIDPSCGGSIELFLVPTSAPRLV